METTLRPLIDFVGKQRLLDLDAHTEDAVKQRLAARLTGDFAEVALRTKLYLKK